MYLNVNKILIILSCLWTIGTSELNENNDSNESGFWISKWNEERWQEPAEVDWKFKEVKGWINDTKDVQYVDQKGCHIPMPRRHVNAPIPFLYDAKPPSVVLPDKFGFINFKFNQLFKLSCTANNKFNWPVKLDSEIKVKCVGKVFLEHNNKRYNYKRFKCNKSPKPKLAITTKKCQGLYTSAVLRVGFQTKYSFLNMYRVCFNTETKQTLYTWYQLKTPKCHYYQNVSWSDVRVRQFGKTKSYDNYNIHLAYKKQHDMVKEIVKSNTMANFYINKAKGEVRFLVPGQLITPREFPYHYQHQATFYYENTAPQWFKFHMLRWRRIQEAINKVLGEVRSKRFLVISGTIGQFQLHDKNATLQNIYLISPKVLTVPKFFWKMIYNYETRQGMVYIGLNTAFDTFTIEERICDATMCPGLSTHNEYKRALVYCCTKESFEKSYGRFDENVFYTF